MDLLGILRRLPEIVAYNKFDDDFFDRLNYSHTVAILTVFAIIVTNKQFSENQIKCWVPAQFTGNYEQYVNQICFITNTYSFNMHETIPDDDYHRHEHELKYYQWTPFILLLMAILFYLPCQLWRGLSLRSGVDLKDLIEAAQTYRSANIRPQDKEKLLDYLINWLNSYCSNVYRLSIPMSNEQRISKRTRLIQIGRYVFFPIGIYTGNYLIISYLFIKFLYFLNAIGQILLLNALLGRQFWYYGIELIHQYWSKEIGILDAGSGYFPKVVLCDFSIREPNHPKESHRYTVQCVLPFNLFNQQIFTYLYFWLIILCIFNAASIIIWIYRVSPYHNLRYLERRLISHFKEKNTNDEEEKRRVFVYQYLQGDGVFMLRLLASNVSDYVCNKIILEIYKVFRDSTSSDTIDRRALFRPMPRQRSKDDDDDDDDDDESTDQTVTAVDLPPVPNPRQGKLFVERGDIIPLSSSDMSTNVHSEPHRTVSFSMPHSEDVHVPLRSSFLPVAKPSRRLSDTQIDPSDRTTTRVKNVDFQIDSDSTPSSSTPPPPPPPPPPIKGPSPYATTYLTTRKRGEHELPYIDDSISSGSTSGRPANVTIVRQAQQPTTTTTLASTSLFFRRSHDV